MTDYHALKLENDARERAARTVARATDRQTDAIKERTQVLRDLLAALVRIEGEEQ